MINEMIEKKDNIWVCTQCGKETRARCDIKNHIEGMHINGMKPNLMIT